MSRQKARFLSTGFDLVMWACDAGSTEQLFCEQKNSTKLT